MTLWLESSADIPAQTRRTELFWWRAGSGLRTVICVPRYGVALDHAQDERRLLAVWFDAKGEPVYRLERADHMGDATILDSALWPETPRSECLLAIFHIESASPRVDPSTLLILSPFVDWKRGPTLVTQHSDQIIRLGLNMIPLTEVILMPEDGAAELVFLNGPKPQPQGAVSLCLRTTEGAPLSSISSQRFEPWTVNRVPLGSQDELRDLNQGRPLTVTGTAQLQDVWARPYVVQDGPWLSSYHAGNVNDHQTSIPRPLQIACGIFNPMTVWESDGVSTFATLFHSQGTCAENVRVSVQVYDERGRLACDVDDVGLLRRGASLRIAFRDLLDGVGALRGYAALSFDVRDGHAEYPSVLQALAEYRTDSAVARAMLWSDDWNSPLRIAELGGVTVCSYCRVWADGESSTDIAVSNVGPTLGGADYGDRARWHASLENQRGQRLTLEGEILPQATLFLTPELFDGEVVSFLAPGGVGVLHMESSRDLAMIQFTRGRTGHTLSVEHLIPIPTVVDEKFYNPAGS